MNIKEKDIFYKTDSQIPTTTRADFSCPIYDDSTAFPTAGATCTRNLGICFFEAGSTNENTGYWKRKWVPALFGNLPELYGTHLVKAQGIASTCVDIKEEQDDGTK